jgi:GTPase
MNKEREKVFLVGVVWEGESKEQFEDSMNELRHLAKTADVEVIDSFIQSLKRPNTGTYVGKGKLQEIANLTKSKHVHTIIFNNNLSPSQSRNISDITRCNVVDRTEIILDIFAKHARTRQAKLQVELAQLEYAYTKLKRLWKHLSRIQGGIGFRGPGETQVEVDRREIRKKTQTLKKRLKDIESTARTKRKKRQNIIAVSLVGYTNAGKSTLFNKLAKENLYTADQLFATLDSTTRTIPLNFEHSLVITDTIGFIRKLPHKLITSFHSTLLDVIEADLLLHVVDISHPNVLELMKSVGHILDEIKVNNKNILVVFNKLDMMGGTHFKFIKKKLLADYPDSVFISAKSGEGIAKLRAKIMEFVNNQNNIIELQVPVGLPNLIAFIRKNAEIIGEKKNLKDNILTMQLKISRQLLPDIKKQIKNYNLIKYINK